MKTLNSRMFAVYPRSGGGSTVPSMFSEDSILAGVQSEAAAVSSGGVLVARNAGAIEHGESYVLTGSGFGTRPDYGDVTPNPSHNGTLVWTLFRWEGSTVEDGTGWNVLNAFQGTYELVSDDPRHARSQKWLRKWNPNNENSNDAYLRAMTPFPAGAAKWFTSFWLRSTTSTYGKTYRPYITGTGFEDWLALGGYSYVFGDFEGAPDTVNHQWRRIDLLLEGTTTGTARQRLWQIGANSNNPTYDENEAGARLSGNANPAIGAGIDVGSKTSMYWGFDDFYTDFSCARVELANHATWASVTYSELQPPISWSDTEIEIRANCGAFTQGQTAHIHVFDADNNRQYWGAVEVA